MSRKLGIIGSPSSAGAFAPGQEQAPAALRNAGLIERLRQAGVDAVDHGDLPAFRWRPDREHPHAQNASAVIANVLAVAASVRRVIDDGAVALVLGGDCTVGVGTVAGHLAGSERFGVIYFDLHADLNVPASVTEGALDWMGVAHMLGESGTLPQLRDCAARQPMLDPEQLLFFGHDAAHATPWELEVIERRQLRRVAVDVVAASPETAAREALEYANQWDRLLVHLDVDVVDFTDAPLSENTGRNYGLRLETTLRALRVLLASPKLSAVTVAELNPDHGEEDGSTVGRFVDGLAACFGEDERRVSARRSSFGVRKDVRA